MGISTTLANRVLEAVLRATPWTAIPGVRLSLHSADPGAAGANEVSGAGYTRQTPTYAAASGGSAAMSSPTSFTNMPAVTVTHVGVWSSDAAPVFLFSGALGGPQREFVVDDTASNLIRSATHGLAAGQAIRAVAPLQGALPTGIVAGSLYYVLAAGLTVNDFAVSATPGGAAIAITTSGNGFWYLDGSKTLNAGDTFTLNTDTVTIQ